MTNKPEARASLIVAEYHAAQEMLRHYDLLRWKIAAALLSLIAALNVGALVFVGLLEFVPLTFVFLLPLLAFLLLVGWGLWVRRHRFLINLRNETLHRLEVQHGMYHHLRVTEANLKHADEKARAAVEQTRLAAGYESTFYPLYTHHAAPPPSGYQTEWMLVYALPLLHFAFWLGLFLEL